MIDEVIVVGGVDEGIDTEVVLAFEDQPANGQLTEKVGVGGRKRGNEEGKQNNFDNEQPVESAAQPQKGRLLYRRLLRQRRQRDGRRLGRRLSAGRRRRFARLR